jgi:hypothetical protein
MQTVNLCQVNSKADASNTEKIYQYKLYHKQPSERSEPGWKGDAENGVREMGIVNWRQAAQDWGGWRRATRETLVRLGYWSHRIRRRKEEEKKERRKEEEQKKKKDKEEKRRRRRK